MAQVKVLFDPVGNTMNIWWGNPQDVVISEETDDPNKNDVLLKDSKGNVVGIEIIGVLPSEVNISAIVDQKNNILPAKPLWLQNKE